MRCKDFVRLAVLLLALSVGPLLAQLPPPGLPVAGQVDQAEILRRGDLVVEAGEGPRSAAERLFVAGMAPPVDDSDQFYLTIFGKSGDARTEALRKAFETDPALACFVAPQPGTSRPWAHFNVYHADDRTQQFRFQAFKIDPQKLPVIVFQPPRDGSYGGLAQIDEGGQKVTRSAVIDRIDAAQLGSSEQIASRLRSSFWLWCQKLEESGFVPGQKIARRLHQEPELRLAASDSHGQIPGPVPRQQPFSPQFPAGGPAAAESNPWPGIGGPLTPSVPTVWSFIATLASGFLVYRSLRQQQGQKLLIPESVVQPLAILLQLLGNQPAPPPAPQPGPVLTPLPEGWKWALINGVPTPVPPAPPSSA
ncbi:MAG TPA: hypothetical protein VFB80_13620 [Pirellulaceae bacterium]|nr:hypothetical protein [Pirellulaceae bacterium]